MPLALDYAGNSLCGGSEASPWEVHPGGGNCSGLRLAVGKVCMKDRVAGGITGNTRVQLFTWDMLSSSPMRVDGGGGGLLSRPAGMARRRDYILHTRGDVK